MPHYHIYIDLFQMQRKACKDQKVPEPDAVEIFKDYHTSKTKGMTTCYLLSMCWFSLEEERVMQQSDQ